MNNFIKKRLTTASSGLLFDACRGYASKPYMPQCDVLSSSILPRKFVGKKKFFCIAITYCNEITLTGSTAKQNQCRVSLSTWFMSFSCPRPLTVEKPRGEVEPTSNLKKNILTAVTRRHSISVHVGKCFSSYSGEELSATSALHCAHQCYGIAWGVAGNAGVSSSVLALMSWRPCSVMTRLRLRM